MGIYWRYKQSPGGFRSLIELLESTAPSKRKKMIDAGLAEDAAYTMEALKYVMEFTDIVKLPDMELAEVLSKTPAQVFAYAVNGLEKPQVDRFLRCSPTALAAEVKVLMETQCTPRDVSGARIKMITIAREAEKRGFVKTKVIPNAA